MIKCQKLIGEQYQPTNWNKFNKLLQKQKKLWSIEDYIRSSENWQIFWRLLSKIYDKLEEVSKLSIYFIGFAICSGLRMFIVCHLFVIVKVYFVSVSRLCCKMAEMFVYSNTEIVRF